MPFRFTPAAKTLYAPGSVFLGLSETGHEIGIKTERHAITVAGSRSGKGAALLIPNLLRWPHNALVIDPKGENAEATWQAREDMGQSVHVLDPFRIADVPDRLRASFNPLASFDPKSLSAREDIRVIADGLVMRYKPEDAMWDNGAVSVLAGVIAHTIANDPEGPSLPGVRRLMRLPPDTLQTVFEDMAQSTVFGGLTQAGAALGLGSERSAREFVKAARDNTEWLDSEPVAAVLSSSTFDLAELKTGNATVYLVLPPQYLDEHGRFLRLFVRCALNEMAKGGRRGSKCLFLLDEFFSLGHISEIAKAAGLMPGYGVHLWPFLQDVGQLQKLYSDHGAETFFGNSDAHIFFGNTDALTLDYISRKLGNITPAEITEAAPLRAYNPISPEDYARVNTPLSGPVNIPVLGKKAGLLSAINFGSVAVQKALGDVRTAEQVGLRQIIENQRQQQAVDEANQRAAYDHAMKSAGSPRLSPQEIRELVGKGADDVVARSMIAFGTGGDVYNLQLAPYFVPLPPAPEPGAEPPLPPEILRDQHAFVALVRQSEETTARRAAALKAAATITVSAGVVSGVVLLVLSEWVLMIIALVAIYFAYSWLHDSAQREFGTRMLGIAAEMKTIAARLTAYTDQHGPNSLG